MTKFYDSIDAPWANVVTAVTGRKVTDEGYQDAQQFSRFVSTAGSAVSIYNGLAGYFNPTPAPSPVYPRIEDFGPGEIIDVDAMTDAQFNALDDIPDSEFDIDDMDSWIDGEYPPLVDEPRIPRADDVFIDRDAPFVSLFTEEQWARLGAPEPESQTFNVLGAVLGVGGLSNSVYNYYQDSVPRGAAPVPGIAGGFPLPSNVTGEAPLQHFPSSKLVTQPIYNSNYFPNYNSIQQWLPNATTTPRRRRRRKIRNA